MTYQIDDLIGRADLLDLWEHAKRDIAGLDSTKPRDMVERCEVRLLRRLGEWRVRQIERAIEISATRLA